MTQEEKDLLLCDLNARLMYGVKVQVEYNAEEFGKTIEIDEITMIDKYGKEILLYHASEYFSIEEFKPYLRPLSSMTEEEANELDAISDGRLIGGGEYLGVLSQHDWTDSFKYILLGINWLNAHHFDIRNLIEKGLALEALEGMYNSKEQ